MLQSVYIGNGAGTAASVSKALNSYEAWLGKSIDAVQVHTGYANWWDWSGSISWAAGINSTVATDHKILWSVPLIPRSEATMAEAAKGTYDNKYVAAAKTLLANSAGSGDIQVRTGWEFNALWSPVSASAVGQAQNYIEAYRNFVDAFRSVSDRFIFEWCPNYGSDGSMRAADAYPGDAYVDIISMDFYWDAKQSWSTQDPKAAWNWILTTTDGLNWLAEFGKAHGKPIAIAEWGVNSDNAEPFLELAMKWFADNNVLYHNYWESNAAFDGMMSGGQYANAGEAFRDIFGPMYVAPDALKEGGATVNWQGGTSGAETIVGDDRNNLIQSGGGKDTLKGGKGDDTYVISSGDGIETIVEKGGEGIDTVKSWSHYTTLSANVENIVLLGTYDQTGTGNELNNIIKGGAGNNIINGMGGNDVLSGGGGKDVFIIGANNGKDTIKDFGKDDFIKLENTSLKTFADVQKALHQNGNDVVLDLGSGNQVFFENHLVSDFKSGNFVFAGLPVNPFIYDVVNANNGTVTWQGGTSYSETITGDSRNNYIFGLGMSDGVDTLIGMKGNDVYNISNGKEIIIEKAGEGTDSVESWAGYYKLADNVENLFLVSYAYAQTGVGNNLNNTIHGGVAANTMTGGLGADTFVFHADALAKVDKITDFSRAQGDKIEINDLLDNYHPLTDAIKDFVHLTMRGADTVLQVDLDGKGGAHGFKDLVVLQNTANALDEATLLKSLIITT